MNELDSDFLDQRFLSAMRSQDYAGAIQFFKERIRHFLGNKDEEGALYASDLLIASLIAAEPDQEALDLLHRVAGSVEGEAFFRSSFAGYLLLSLQQPTKAWEVLEPALGELMAEEGCRHATLGLQGSIFCALGKYEEAKRCLEDMLQPSLWRMDPSAFDFRLVESLISAGLIRDRCEDYLKIVHQRAQELNDEEVTARSARLSRSLRQEPG